MSKDLFQLGNRFFFVARKNITVYDSAFNFGPKSGYKINIGPGLVF